MVAAWEEQYEVVRVIVDALIKKNQLDVEAGYTVLRQQDPQSREVKQQHIQNCFIISFIICNFSSMCHIFIVL